MVLVVERGLRSETSARNSLWVETPAKKSTMPSALGIGKVGARVPAQRSLACRRARHCASLTSKVSVVTEIRVPTTTTRRAVSSGPNPVARMAQSVPFRINSRTRIRRRAISLSLRPHRLLRSLPRTATPRIPRGQPAPSQQVPKKSLEVRQRANPAGVGKPSRRLPYQVMMNRMPSPGSS